MWLLKYNEASWEHSMQKRGASKSDRSGTATFENNCYGYATDYQYTLSARGFSAIVAADGYKNDKTLFCKTDGIVTFKTDHCVWIAECCGVAPCEGKETLKEIRERFGCSPKIWMTWPCDKKLGGGKLANVDTIHFK